MFVDKDGNQIPIPVPSQTDVDQLVAYAKAVYPVQDAKSGGLALSQLRRPNDSTSLQKIERIANAAVTAGKMRIVWRPTRNGNSVAVYFWV
jgi:hypothetical protein